MYEKPSDETIEECIINEDVVNQLADPELKYKNNLDAKIKRANKKAKNEQIQPA